MNLLSKLRVLLIVVFALVSLESYSQGAVGYEMRTNGKSYVSFGYKGFELRHRTTLGENRISYRYNIKTKSNFVLSIPLHYKIEKNEPTLEPRLIYKFTNFNLWVQQEVGINELHNAAIAVDIPYKNFRWRVGWDTSDTWRFRWQIKF